MKGDDIMGLSKKLQIRIVQLHKAGYTVEEISKATGVSEKILNHVFAKKS